MARPVRLTFHGTLLALTVAVLALMALTPARQLYRYERRVAAEEARLAALQEANAHQEERLARFRDPEEIEVRARRELGLVRPGEVAYMVVPPEPSSPPEPPPPPHGAWWETAWEWILRSARAL